MLKLGIVSFFEYLLMLMIVLEFNTPYTYFPIIKNSVIFFIILSAIVLILFNWRYLTLDVFAFAFLIMVGAIFPFFNVYDGRSLSYVKLYFVILPLFLVLLSSYMNRRDSASYLLIKFSNLVVAIAIISLFFWLMGSTLELIPSTAIIPNLWGEDRFIPTYYGVYFETQEATASVEIGRFIRNSGIFNEAPMYNMILCTALSIEMFLRSRVYVKRIILFTLTIITTISTTGFIFMFVVYAIKGYHSFASRYRLQMILLLPIFFLASLFVMNSILDNKKETGEGSYNSRSSDIIKCIEVGMENPIAGLGIFFVSEEGSSESRSFGYSNSLFGVFAHGGFYLLTLYVLSLLIIPIVSFFRDRNLSFFIFMLSYFLLFTFTLSQYKCLTILLVAYGFVYWYNIIFESK